jgi:hypothetical protein
MSQAHVTRGFLIHFSAFVVAVGSLTALNLYRHLRFIWVLAGWGIGVAAHDLALLLRALVCAKRSSPTRGGGAFSFISSSISR